LKQDRAGFLTGGYGTGKPKRSRNFIHGSHSFNPQGAFRNPAFAQKACFALITTASIE